MSSSSRMAITLHLGWNWKKPVAVLENVPYFIFVLLVCFLQLKFSRGLQNETSHRADLKRLSYIIVMLLTTLIMTKVEIGWWDIWITYVYVHVNVDVKNTVRCVLNLWKLKISLDEQTRWILLTNFPSNISLFVVINVIIASKLTMYCVVCIETLPLLYSTRYREYPCNNSWIKIFSNN